MISTFWGALYSKKCLILEIPGGHVPPWPPSYLDAEIALCFRYDYDGIFEATPGCRRAVRTAIEAAESIGMKVMPFRPFGLTEAFKLNSSYRWGDLGATKKAQLSIGPSSQISLGIKLLHWKLPWWIRFILGHGTQYAFIIIMNQENANEKKNVKSRRRPFQLFGGRRRGALIVAQIDIVDFLSLREHIAAESFLKPQLDFVLV